MATDDRESASVLFGDRFYVIFTHLSETFKNWLVKKKSFLHIKKNNNNLYVIIILLSIFGYKLNHLKTDNFYGVRFVQSMEMEINIHCSYSHSFTTIFLLNLFMFDF